MVRVLFVCMRNICRSPIAQGVFEEVVRREGLEDEILVDSAGTHSYHLSKAPDPWAPKSAARRGIDISSQQARRLGPEDCQEFDYVLVMDKKNRRRVKRLCKGGAAEVRLFLDYAPELPDPYHGGGPEGFELVMDLVEAASEGLLEDIRRRHLSDLQATHAGSRLAQGRRQRACLLDRLANQRGSWHWRFDCGVRAPLF